MLCNLTDHNLRYLWVDCNAGSVVPAAVVDDKRSRKVAVGEGMTTAMFVLHVMLLVD
ncbi:hypothetical protein ACHAXA_005278 [Cyclostephanos tholiformis]|uniref:Uncharacterized protein n=1 Tax=Cyclostephanos tholiformis TaxID=382380 RepID=A0ABD3R8A5_9STRA